MSLTGCLLYLGTTAALICSSPLTLTRSAREATILPGDDPSWKFRNPEFEQWLQEIKAERETLAQREKDLDELQKRLQSERQEILAATQAVFEIQKEFDRNVIRIREQQVPNLKHQTKVISGMTPEGGAAMLNQFPEEEMVRILFTLKPDEASAILDALSKQGKNEAKRAADLADRLRKVLPPEPKSSRANAGG